MSGTTVYAGGYFTTIGGQARSRIAALDAITGRAMAWDPCANDGVSARVLGGGKVHAGGQFSTMEKLPFRGYARMAP